MKSSKKNEFSFINLKTSLKKLSQIEDIIF